MTGDTATIVVTDQSFGGTPAAEAVAARTGAVLRSLQARTEAETIEAARGADVLLVQYAPITDAVLAVLGPGATVVRYGIGYDNIDMAAARARGVRVATVPDYGVDTVADHAVALILATMRRVVQYDRLLRASRSPVDPAAVGAIPELGSATVGLVGTGRIGRAVADRLRPFGVRLLAFDPYASPDAASGISFVSLEELLATSDAISLHAPATPDTHHLIDARRLAGARPGIVLVNTARGALVDAEALAAALRSGVVAAAALDVVDPEPLDPASALWDAPNLTLTPHVAFYSVQSLERLERLAAEEAERAVRGEPLRCEVLAP